MTGSNEVWNAIIEDTDAAHYAMGGSGGTALGEVSLIQDTDTLVAVDDQITVTFPTAIPERETQRGLGAGLYPNKMGTTSIPPGQGSINCWLQTDDWYDKAISGAFNTIMDTFTWHTDNGEEELDHFGCWVEKYVLTLEKGKASLQEITPRSRSWKAGNAMTKVAFTASDKFYMEDLNSATTLIDGLSAATLVINKIVLTITNTVELEKSYGLGDNKIQQPRLTMRDVTVEVFHLVESTNTWAADARNETRQLGNIDIVPFAGHTIDLNNLFAESTNTDENEHGIKLHSVIFRAGDGFAIA